MNCNIRKGIFDIRKAYLFIRREEMKMRVQPEGNYYDKYHSTNPIVKWMMNKFFCDFKELLQQTEAVNAVLEAGCGEGEISSLLWEYFGKSCEIKAFDISEKIIQKAKNENTQIEFSVGNIYDLNARGGMSLSYVLRYWNIWNLRKKP